jgi:glyoxylase-like metal-dependent hydrolase (beta-lactamase superfamily II)
VLCGICAVPRPMWERFEAALWSTTSLLVVVEGESLVVDPAISSEEVAGIGRRALELDAPIRHVLITHGDWDHVCGIACFPDAAAVMGEETAERVRSRGADSVQRAAETYGLEVSGPPRVDQTFTRGAAIELGPFVVETFPLTGHTDDGTGYRIRDLGLLVVGDHLSPVEFPFAKSPAAYRFTLAGLIETLREDPAETVIPGHGPPLEPEEALRIAEADLNTCALCTRPSSRYGAVARHARKHMPPDRRSSFHATARRTSPRCATSTSTGKSTRSSLSRDTERRRA